MNAPVMVDLRNVYSRAVTERHGFSYTGIGTVAAR
jgi:UDPglucose 6-dehydrogenase